MESIIKRCEVKDKPNDKNIKNWFVIARKLYNEYTGAYNKGEYERAYIFLRRFVTIVVEIIPKNRQFLKQDKEFKDLQMLAVKAMPKLENIHDLLENYLLFDSELSSNSNSDLNSNENLESKPNSNSNSNLSSSLTTNVNTKKNESFNQKPTSNSKINENSNLNLNKNGNANINQNQFTNIGESSNQNQNQFQNQNQNQNHYQNQDLDSFFNQNFSSNIPPNFNPNSNLNQNSIPYSTSLLSDEERDFFNPQFNNSNSNVNTFQNTFGNLIPDAVESDELSSPSLNKEEEEGMSIEDMSNLLVFSPIKTPFSSNQSSILRSSADLLKEKGHQSGKIIPKPITAKQTRFDDSFHFLRPTPTSSSFSQPPQNMPINNNRPPNPINVYKPSNQNPISPQIPPKSQSSFSTQTPKVLETSQNIRTTDLLNGLSGLKNLGNTCFMNATLQALSTTLPLTRIFLNGNFKTQINYQNTMGTKGELVKCYAELMQGLWNERGGSISPTKFKRVIEQFAPQFAGDDQHDAQEFLSFLLDAIHEDLNRSNRRTRSPDPEDPKIPVITLGKICWEKYLERNNSFVVDIFQGQLKSTLTCSTCQTDSTSFNPFMYLSLPIRSMNQSTLFNSINAYIETEVLDEKNQWFCPKCKEKRSATKKLSLWKLPDILILHFKRFHYSGIWRDKIETFIDFPLKGLDFSPFVDNFEEKERANIYDVYAIINHTGGMNGGHYTSFCLHPYQKQWYCYDDTRVFRVNESDVKTRAAYVVFCVRRSPQSKY